MYIQIAKPAVGEEEWQALKEPIMNGWITQGNKVYEFENKFMAYHGIKHGVATTSCTTALQLAIESVKMNFKDYGMEKLHVIVPSFTWIATANIVEIAGCVPVFCDVDLDTYNMSVKSFSSVLEKLRIENKKVIAVIPVHLFGLSADMDEIVRIAKEHGLSVIEDAACAVGAKYKGRYVGGLSDIGCFSFHPRKVLTTGEGGMCTTNSAELFESMVSMRNHGASISEEQRHNSDAPYLMPGFNIIGYNYRMTDIQAAMGVVQLGKLDRFLEERDKIEEYYNESLRSVDWLQTPITPPGYKHTFQSYVCTIKSNSGKNRNEIMKYLHERGIASRPGTIAVHRTAYYRNKYNLSDVGLENTAYLDENSIGLPFYNGLRDDDMGKVVEVLQRVKQ